MFKFDDKFKELINLQVTTTKNGIDFYEKLSKNEYEILKLYLDPYPKRILEIGCGLGRMSIFLNKKHPSDSKYFLADSSKITTGKNIYGWNPGTWYNDLQLTKEFCLLNELNNFEIIDLSKTNLNFLKDIDFVFSVMSVGFHYPIEPYINILKNIIKKDAIIIFGIRTNMYENSEFFKDFKFTTIQNIPNEPKERFLILRGLK